MFKRVDADGHASIEGFSYISKVGTEEAVVLEETTVFLSHAKSGDAMSAVFVEDIPNLIKALQAAYDYKRSEQDRYK